MCRVIKQIIHVLKQTLTKNANLLKSWMASVFEVNCSWQPKLWASVDILCASIIKVLKNISQQGGNAYKRECL